MDTPMWRTWVLIVVMLAGLFPLTAAEASAECPITEGAGIGSVVVSQSATAALAATGPPLRQQAVGSQVVYTLPPPWSQMITDYGIVRRVSTQTAQCRTQKGIGPGSTLAAVRDAYAGANVSSVTPVQDGTLLSYPFIGVAFLLRGDRVQAVEVFQAEGTRAARPVGPVAQASPSAAASRGISPSPTPTTAAGAWSIRSTSISVEGGTFVVSGVVENRSQPLSAYAEVRAIGADSRRVGQGEAPLRPTLVPNGGRATFEVRLSVDGIPRRYTVTIRPAGRSNDTLAQFTGELKDKDLQQFGPIVAQFLQATVQSTAATPNPNGFVVLVTNGSSLPVMSVHVDVELSITCRVPVSHAPPAPASVMVAFLAAPPPTPRPTPVPTPPPAPRPTPRTIQETWRGSATVQGISPGGTGRAPVQLSGGVCLEFTSWTATTRMGDIRISE